MKRAAALLPLCLLAAAGAGACKRRPGGGQAAPATAAAAPGGDAAGAPAEPAAAPAPAAPTAATTLARRPLAEVLADPASYHGELLDLAGVAPGAVPREERPASPYTRLLVAALRAGLRPGADVQHPALRFADLEGCSLAELRADLARYQAGKAGEAALYPAEVDAWLEDPAAAGELQRRVIAARDEFVVMARARGVAAPTLAALEEVLPAAPDRILYLSHARKPDPSRQTGAFDLEGSRTRMVLSIHAAKLKLPDFPQARLLDAVPDAALRARMWVDLSLRLVVYHEMIHVLQQALVRAQLPEGGKDEPWSHADLPRHHGLVEPEGCLAWGQGKPDPSFILCVQYANERQAEGLMMELLFDAYHLDERQREQLLFVRFGALAAADLALLDAVRRFDAAHPDVYLDDYMGRVLDALRADPEGTEADRDLLAPFGRRYGNLEIGVAYSDPLWDWPRFWRYFAR